MKVLEYDNLLILVLVIGFSLYALTLPSFNGDKLYNPFFDNYSLKWFDGKSPMVFYSVKKVFYNHTVVFSKDSPVFKKYSIDFFKKEEGFVPLVGVMNIFSRLPGALPGLISGKDLLIYKGMLIQNIISASLTLIFFYLSQKEIGLKRKYAFFSSAGLGFLTGTMIYTRYFFKYIPFSCFFSMSLYFFIKYSKSDKTRHFFLLMLSLGLMLLCVSWISPIFYTLPFFVYLVKQKGEKEKILIAFLILFFGVYFVNKSIYFSYKWPKIPKSPEVTSRFPFFSRYKAFISPNTFEIYGYQIPTNRTWVTGKAWDFLYSFESLPGNALFFMSSSGIFKTLFSEKGFVYNSPFLIFSILGIFFWEKENWIRNFLVLLTLVGLTPALLMSWHGGFSPRYVRNFPIPIMALTCFAFSYLQGEKRKWVLALFVILVLISFLNVSSLAVRKDWTYEGYSDLPSYDWVLWPYFNTTATRRVKWNEWVTNPTCEIYPNGVLDVCRCEYRGYIKKRLKVPKDYPILVSRGCSKKAGGDGVYLNIYLNGKREKKLFFSENTCKKISLNLSESKREKVEVKIEVEKHGKCNAEMVEVLRVYWSKNS